MKTITASELLDNLNLYEWGENVVSSGQSEYIDYTTAIDPNDTVEHVTHANTYITTLTEPITGSTIIFEQIDGRYDSGIYRDDSENIDVLLKYDVIDDDELCVDDLIFEIQQLIKKMYKEE